MKVFPTELANYGAGGQVISPKMSIGEFGSANVCMDTVSNFLGLAQ